MDLKAQASPLRLRSSKRQRRWRVPNRWRRPVTRRPWRGAGRTGCQVATQNKRLSSSAVRHCGRARGARRANIVGDSYNDRPSSLQHADDLSVRIAEAEAELQYPRPSGWQASPTLDAEAARYSELSNAVLASPVDAQVWESWYLRRRGEEGQDLLRLLDWSGALVTVTVRIRVNQLRVGDKAQFRYSAIGQIQRHDRSGMSGSAALQTILRFNPRAFLRRISPWLCRSLTRLVDECGVGAPGGRVQSLGRLRRALQSLRTRFSFFLPGSWSPCPAAGPEPIVRH